MKKIKYLNVLFVILLYQTSRWYQINFKKHSEQNHSHISKKNPDYLKRLLLHKKNFNGKTS